MTHTSRGAGLVESSLVALLFAVLGVGGAIYGSQISMPELASRHGAGIDSMLNYLLVSVGSIFVVGYLILAYLIWGGARRDRITSRLASRRFELMLSGALGFGMALVAEGGVLAIGMPVWAEYFDAAPNPDAIRVEVTAQQFMWNVRYPGPDGTFGRTDARLIDDTTNPLGMVRDDPAGRDDVFTINEIAVPVNRPVRVRLLSKDVIHSFFLPHLRVKQDAVPGMSPEVTFVPTRIGDYEVACAELCGLAHYRMRGFFHVVRQAEFDEWLRTQGEP